MSDEEKLKIQKQNLTQLILKSTALPFRWLKNSYRCFYCYDIFDEPDDLRRHNRLHDDREKRDAIDKDLELTVYIDAMNIECKLCSFQYDDMYEIMDHLICEHGVYFNKDVELSLRPFKLSSLNVQCCDCAASYKTFSYLLVHTNKEHKGAKASVLCDLCGSYFRTTYHLKIHKRKKHKKVDFKCTECDEIIPNYNKLKTHMQNYHEKKYKCFYCEEMLDTHYKRTMHMLTQHKIRDKIACPHCPKTFVFRSTMKRHLRETHLQEKNVVCPECGWKAFEFNRLQRHMMKHSNERNHPCTRCEKAFKTKKTLRQHVQNVHLKEFNVAKHYHAEKLANYNTQMQYQFF